jgi:hypothetical protein
MRHDSSHTIRLSDALNVMKFAKIVRFYYLLDGHKRQVVIHVKHEAVFHFFALFFIHMVE